MVPVVLIYKCAVVHGIMRALAYTPKLIDAPFVAMVSLVFNVFIFPYTLLSDVRYLFRQLKYRKKEELPFPFYMLDENYVAPRPSQYYHEI